MKTIYVGVPKMYVSEADVVAIELGDIPGVRVRPISIPHLAIVDLAYQTSNPPDDLIGFWIREQRRFDRNYWVGKFMSYATIARSNIKEPFAVIMLAGCDDDPILCKMMDVIYKGSLNQVVDDVKMEVKRRLGGGEGEES